jgi:hypothetical protein
MNRRRLLTSLCVAPATLLAAPTLWAQSAANPFDYPAAINRAGRQRALSQRISKAYAQLGLGIETDDARKVLAISVANFERSLGLLRTQAPSAEIRETYENLDAIWQRAKPLVQAAPSKDNAARLLALDAQLLQTANLGTLQFQQASGQASAVLVNVAGRQRMLSQRIAKWQFCRIWGVEAAQAVAEVPKSRQEFLAAMTRLKEQARSDTQKDALRAAELQWVFFDAAIGNPALGAGVTGSAAAQRQLASASELILAAFDDVTTAFERGAAG